MHGPADRQGKELPRWPGLCVGSVRLETEANLEEDVPDAYGLALDGCGVDPGSRAESDLCRGGESAGRPGRLDTVILQYFDHHFSHRTGHGAG